MHAPSWDTKNRIELAGTSDESKQLSSSSRRHLRSGCDSSLMILRLRAPEYSGASRKPSGRRLWAGLPPAGISPGPCGDAGEQTAENGPEGTCGPGPHSWAGPTECLCHPPPDHEASRGPALACVWHSYLHVFPPQFHGHPFPSCFDIPFPVL